MIEFQITTRHTGKPRRVIVRVYKDRPAMIAAIKRRHKLEGKDMGEEWYSETVASAVGQWQDLVWKKSGRPAGRDHRVLITFNAKEITWGTIAHEAAHAAVYLYQADIQKTIPDMDREEKLCYLVGDISQQIYRRLMNKGFTIFG